VIRDDKGANRRVIRAGSPLVTFWLVVVCVVFLLGDAALRRDGAVFGISVAPCLLAVWGAWVLFLRPCVVLTPDSITARNIGRVVEMPWGQVEDARLRFGLVVDLVGGGHVNCWGGPFAARPGVARRSVLARRGGEPDTPSLDAGEAALRAVQAVHDEALVAAADPVRAAVLNAPVSRRWDTIPLVIGAVLVVAVVIEALAF
jgi:hypothetical protein